MLTKDSGYSAESGRRFVKSGDYIAHNYHPGVVMFIQAGHCRVQANGTRSTKSGSNEISLQQG